MNRIWGVIATILCVTFFPATVARADPASPPVETPLAETLSGPARDAYFSAGLLFHNGDFAGAIAKFQQAYDLSKEPRLLFDMALAEKNRHSYARMQKLLERYEGEASATMSAKEKAIVDRAVAAIHNLVATVRLDVSEAGATVSIDGEPAGTTPLAEPLLVDLGKHMLSAQKTGFESTSKTIDVQGGAAVTVELVLAPEKHWGQLRVVGGAESTIVIDEKTIAKGQFDRQVSTGTHNVRVTAVGKLPYESNVDVRDHEIRTLEVTLRPGNTGHGGRPMWPWIVGGTVLVAGGAAAAYFLLQPHDTTSPIGPGSLGRITLSSSPGR